MRDTSINMPFAAHVIKKCGGVRRVAVLTGRAEASVYKWRWPKDKGGTGGLVPADPQQELIEAAKRGEVDLTPADFFDWHEPLDQEARHDVQP